MHKKSKLKKVWNFIWNDNSIYSWILNVILAFVIVKFLILPGFGFVLDSEYPVVVVMSGSMEHDIESSCIPNGYCSNWICGKSYSSSRSLGFDEYWYECGGPYEEIGIHKGNFYDYDYRNGFDKGALMFVKGQDDYEVGDVIVFEAGEGAPLIHRIIKIEEGKYTTKGDHNGGIKQNEMEFSKSQIYGKAFLRIPYIGWIKLGAMRLFGANV